MKGKRFTEEQITYALRQAEGGTPVADVCRQLGVSEASFYLWRRKTASSGMTRNCTVSTANPHRTSCAISLLSSPANTALT